MPNMEMDVKGVSWMMASGCFFLQDEFNGRTSGNCRLHHLFSPRYVPLLITSTLTHNLNLSGALFTHWIADSLTLWKSPVTDEHLWTAASYYSILTKGPPQILYFLFALLFLGGTTILWSFGDGQAGNLMFDGGSICA